jgi:hypothetical protein
VVCLIIGGVGVAPYALPVLPIAALPRYLSLLGVKAVRPERRAEGAIPQLFADMLGWQETVAAVARVLSAPAALPCISPVALDKPLLGL